MCLLIEFSLQDGQKSSLKRKCSCVACLKKHQLLAQLHVQDHLHPRRKLKCYVLLKCVQQQMIKLLKNKA